MRTQMKCMLLGIFLMVFSVWSLLFGVVDDVVLFSAIGVFLPIVAASCFFIGFCGEGLREPGNKEGF